MACSGEKPSTPSDDGAIPQRVVVLGPGTAANLETLGLLPQVVAVSDFNTLPEADHLPRIGGLFDPNLERIVSLQPDLVLLQGQNASLEELCTQNGVEFRAFSTDSLDEWRGEVRWLADRFDVAPLGEEVIGEFDRALADLAGVPSAEAPGVLLVVSRRDGEASGLVVAGGASFLSELCTAAGARNLYADSARDYFELSEERLIRLEPDVILEFEAMGAKDSLAIWRRDFPQLPAVMAGRVHALKSRDALIPGPAMLETARAMSEAFSE